MATARISTVAVALVVFLMSAASPAQASRHESGTSAAAVLADRLADLPGGPRGQVLDAALAAYGAAAEAGVLARPDLLTVIDYTRPSTERRLWVIDLVRLRVVFHELVAHGKNSGDNLTRFFSNAQGSLMSSLGLFVTGGSYSGANGYSLRLHGRDAGLNDNAFARAIVLHGAPYVSETIAARLGRLGRSWGCPAVRAEVAHRLIDTIKGGSAIFAYGTAAGAQAALTEH